MLSPIKIVLALVTFLVLSACKETVHSELPEREANEIVAVLYAEGIAASKEPLKNGVFAISVPKPDFGRALAVLTKVGLPRESFSTIGDVFPDDSVVGTAFEERARFSFALSQELARTLTEVEGVQYARVHIVIPEKGRFADAAPASKAALAIYHKPDFDKALHVPQIKKLTAFSVPNLSYDDVSVSLFIAGAAHDIQVVPVQPSGSAVAAAPEFMAQLVGMDSDLTSIMLMALALLTAVFVVARLAMGVWSFLVRSVSNAG